MQVKRFWLAISGFEMPPNTVSTSLSPSNSAYHRLDWDNLRVFLLVARRGSATLAQDSLQMNLSTITRRIYQLEKALNLHLFIRNRHGHTLTTEGQKLLAHCEKIEETLYHMNATISEGNQRVAGYVRVGSTDGFGANFLAYHMASFPARYPELIVDLVAVPRIISMQKFEADIAIYVDRPNDQNLISVRLCDCQLRLYATENYWQDHPIPKKISDLQNPKNRHVVVAYTEDLAFSPQLNFMRRLLPQYQSRLSCTSIVGQAQMVRSGQAIGFLPCFIANPFPELRPLLPATHINLTYWMFTYNENRKNQRIRTIWEELRAIAEKNRPYLMGESTTMIGS